MLPLAGYRVGVTAARKAEEQVRMLERRGATVLWAPALSTDLGRVDDAALRAATDAVLSRPVQLLLGTTGIGMRKWFAATDEWGLTDRLVEHLAGAEILARGPKTVGALRRRGLAERWVAPGERVEEMVEHLRDRDLAGVRVVVQEHGQSLESAVRWLRDRGADVAVVTVYRIAVPEDPAPLHELAERVAGRELQAVTFTSAPAVDAFMAAAERTGREADVVTALSGPVLAACVGPVTASAFDAWRVPTVHPDRSRLAAMVRQVEDELLARAGRTA